MTRTHLDLRHLMALAAACCLAACDSDPQASESDVPDTTQVSDTNPDSADTSAPTETSIGTDASETSEAEPDVGPDVEPDVEPDTTVAADTTDTSDEEIEADTNVPEDTTAPEDTDVPGDTNVPEDTTAPDETSVAEDTTAEVEVDEPFEIEVNITPLAPKTADDLVLGVTGAPMDADVTVVWTRNAVPVVGVVGTVPAALTTKGETWTVTVDATYGAYSDSASASVVIANSAPVIGALAILESAGARAGCKRFTCTAVSSDADGDPLTITTQWRVGTTVVADGAELDLVTGFTVGQAARCYVTASDDTVTANREGNLLLTSALVDTDDDSFCDVIDVCAGLDDALFDVDGDTLCKDEEDTLGTSDELTDSDADSLHDRDELALGNDPAVADDTFVHRTLFVGSRATLPNLGYPDGVDLDYCQELAHAAGLAGRFVALVSVNGGPARDRLDPGAFFRPDGRVLASDVADLLDGSLHNTPSVDEGGATRADTVYTGTTASGEVHLNRSCESWSKAANASSFVGLSSSTSGTWLSAHQELGCGAQARFYCVGVDPDPCNPITCDDEGCASPATTCDDDNACTADHCEPGVGCVNETITCDDGDACTADSCSPLAGCVAAAPTVFAHGASSYQVCSAALPYADAEAMCLARGMRLAVMNSAAESDALAQARAASGAPRLWIGLDDREVEGTFMWQSASPDFTDWCDVPPSFVGSGDDLDCVVTSACGGDAGWSEIACSETARFACERTCDDRDPCTDEALVNGACVRDDSGCDDDDDETLDWCDVTLGCRHEALDDHPNACALGASEAHGKCYRALFDDADQGRAAGGCAAFGGWLATITDTNDVTLRALADETCGAEDAWIGLTDRRSEGDFEWADGNTYAYMDWALDEPDDAHGLEDGVVMQPDGTWADRSSGALASCALCEEPRVLDPSLPPVNELPVLSVALTTVDSGVEGCSYLACVPSATDADGDDLTLSTRWELGNSSGTGALVSVFPSASGAILRCIVMGDDGFGSITLTQSFVVTFDSAERDLDSDGTCDALDDDRDGDGLENDEEVTLGTDPDDPAGPMIERRTLFVGSEPTLPNLGYPDGVDDYCQTLAQDAGLTGTYRALVSVNEVGIGDLLDEAAYFRPDGRLLAESRAKLLSGGLWRAPNIDERGATYDGSVFTGTAADGSAQINRNCELWSGVGAMFVGNSARQNDQWLISYELGCADGGEARFYCVEDTNRCTTLAGAGSYVACDEAVTRAAAQILCSARGLDLAMIDDADEDSALADTRASLGIDAHWLDLADEDQDGRWYASAGSSDYRPWCTGAPSDGACVLASSCWETSACDARAAYVCEARCDDADPCTDEALVGGVCTTLASGCDDGGDATIDWCDPLLGCRSREPEGELGNTCDEGTLLNGRCYLALDAEMDLVAAAGACVDLGGSLASIGDEAENTMVGDVASACGSSAWIGLGDRRAEGVYEWFDGSPWVLERWADGQPDDGAGAEDAVIIGPNNVWYDTSSASTAPCSVCELPAR